ncbi:hypothetical protein ABK040_014180 [Willaertia magna]
MVKVKYDKCVFIIGVDPDTEPKILQDALSEIIPNKINRVIMGKRDSIKTGFAFAELKSKDDIEEAINKCNGILINGKKIKVEKYSNKKQKEEEEKKKKEEEAEDDDPFNINSDTSSDEDELEEGTYDPKVLIISNLNKNLTWKKTMADLEEKYNKFGPLNIRLPKKGPTQHKGYCFLEYKRKGSADFALKWTKKHTPLRVSYKQDREEYVKKKQDEYLAKKEQEFNEEYEALQGKKKVDEPEEYYGEDDNEMKDDDEEEEETKEKDLGELLALMKDEKDDKKEKKKKEEEDSMEADDEEEEKEEKKEKKIKKRSEEETKRLKDKVDCKKTIFVQNLPIKISKDEVQEFFKQYGFIEYVAICPTKAKTLTGEKCFIKFKRFSDVKKLLSGCKVVENTSDPFKDENNEENERVGNTLYELDMDGRRLLVSRALSKSDVKEKEKEKEKDKDPRNLHLAKIGYISPHSPEAKLMPDAILKKYQYNQVQKNTQLKNPIYHVSKTRVCIQLLPKTWTAVDLRQLVLNKVKYDDILDGKKPEIVQIKLLKDKETNQSKGFAFVEFKHHEHALRCLMTLNNNPYILDPRLKESKLATANRLIAEFAVENTMMLDILEKAKERSKQHHASKNSKNILLKDFKADIDKRPKPKENRKSKDQYSDDNEHKKRKRGKIPINMNML